MKIISWNINGLRAISKKGFSIWLKKNTADIICLQEIKAQSANLPPELLEQKKYTNYYSFAHKKGYSGVAIFTKRKPIDVSNKLGFKRFDQEGRFLRLDFTDFVLINTYLPQGDRTKKNLPYKLLAYKKLLLYINKIKNKPLILIGDFNIAHTELDLSRPKSNQKNTMFTPEERKQLAALTNLGMIDTFRYFHPKTRAYTWWPYINNARQRNIGWRLDYAFISPALKYHLKSSEILKNIYGSDHCPISLSFRWI